MANANANDTKEKMAESWINVYVVPEMNALVQLELELVACMRFALRPPQAHQGCCLPDLKLTRNVKCEFECQMRIRMSNANANANANVKCECQTRMRMSNGNASATK